jgi:hypothetical protein
MVVVGSTRKKISNVVIEALHANALPGLSTDGEASINLDKPDEL